MFRIEGEDTTDWFAMDLGIIELFAHCKGGNFNVSGRGSAILSAKPSKGNKVLFIIW